MSVSVLKTTSKTLLSIVQRPDLSATTVVAALDLLAPCLKSPAKQPGPLVCAHHAPECVLPVGHTTNQSYGLTLDGLQQQMFVQSRITNAFFNNAAQHILAQNKGVMFVDGGGDNSVWFDLYGYAQASGHQQRLRAINFMRGGQSPKNTHSVNVLSGLSRKQLKSWIELICQSACDTHPHLNVTSVKKHAAVFSAVYSYLSHSLDVFLTFSRMREWGTIETFTEIFPKTVLGQVMDIDFSSWEHTFEQWSCYIAPLCEQWAHVLDQPQPDMHLMHSLRNKEIILTLLPALEKPLADVRMLSNIMAATFVQHLQQTSQFNGVGFFNHAEEIMSPNLFQKISNHKTSWGVVWGSHDWVNTGSQTQFLMRTEHHLMKNVALPTAPLNADEGYLICNTDRVKISAFYTAAPKTQTIKLPKPLILQSPREVSTHFNCPTRKMEEILQNQMHEKTRNLAWCQETVARLCGYNSWHEAIHAHT